MYTGVQIRVGKKVTALMSIATGNQDSKLYAHFVSTLIDLMVPVSILLHVWML